MVSMRSHKPEEVLQALKAGTTVWILDTMNAGEDDVLIGGSQSEVERDIMNHFELNQWPDGWTLTQVGPGDDWFVRELRASAPLTEADLRETLDNHDWTTATSHADIVATEGDIDWVIIPLADGRWVATDDAEVSGDRITIHPTREAAVADLWSGWQISYPDYSEDQLTDRFGWLGPELNQERQHITIVPVDSSGRPVHDSSPTAQPAPRVADDPELSR